MAHTGIQIYCRRPSLGEVDALLSMGVEFVGWHVRPQDGDALTQARQIAELVASRGATSSLLVHSRKVEVLRAIADMVRPDFLLMSSDRDDREMELLARSVAPHARLMMSVPVPPAGSTAKIESQRLADEYATYAGCLILDTCPDPVAIRQFGCTGIVNDWELGAKIVEGSHIPVILAGGLNSHNVADAIRRVRPHAVDACTSLEFFDRSKDLARCRAFVAVVRSAT